MNVHVPVQPPRCAVKSSRATCPNASWLNNIMSLEPLFRSGQHRDSTEDRSHRPHRLQTSLTEAQEQIVVAVRKTLLLSLDDL